MEHPDQPGHPYVVSEMAQGGQRSFMVRTSPQKYMVFPGAKRVEMLFDMKADPNETTNLAADPAFASQLARHRKFLAEWRQTTEEDRYQVGPGPKVARRRAKREKTRSRNCPDRSQGRCRALGPGIRVEGLTRFPPSRITELRMLP